jgi:hypothetical protein
VSERLTRKEQSDPDPQARARTGQTGSERLLTINLISSKAARSVSDEAWQLHQTHDARVWKKTE